MTNILINTHTLSETIFNSDAELHKEIVDHSKYVTSMESVFKWTDGNLYLVKYQWTDNDGVMFEAENDMVECEQVVATSGTEYKKV